MISDDDLKVIEKTALEATEKWTAGEYGNKKTIGFEMKPIMNFKTGHMSTGRAFTYGKGVDEQSVNDMTLAVNARHFVLALVEEVRRLKSEKVSE